MKLIELFVPNAGKRQKAQEKIAKRKRDQSIKKPPIDTEVV